MAGQVLPLIDFRTQAERQGITRTQQTAQAIAGILQTLGQAEQKRRERQKLDRITRAIAGGATTIEAISAAAGQGPGFSGGIPGALQKVGGMFQPQTSGGIEQGIQRLIIGQKLRQALMPPTAPVVEAPTKQQTQRDRDLAILANKKKSEFQKKEARKRLDKDPSQPRNPVPSGADYKVFLEDDDKENGKFGAKAYETALKRIEDEARRQGLGPEQVKKDFDRWWDERVKDERSGFMWGGLEANVTIPRAEFQNVANISATDVRLQSAPDMQLDPFWNDLPDGEKKEIIQRLDEDPKNIDAILRILERG